MTVDGSPTGIRTAARPRPDRRHRAPFFAVGVVHHAALGIEHHRRARSGVKAGHAGSPRCVGLPVRAKETQAPPSPASA